MKRQLVCFLFLCVAAVGFFAACTPTLEPVSATREIVVEATAVAPTPSATIVSSPLPPTPTLTPEIVILTPTPSPMPTSTAPPPTVSVPCAAAEWIIFPLPAICPGSAPAFTPAIAQEFENGLLIADEGNQLLYVFLHDGSYRLLDLPANNGAAVTDPPADRFAPADSFAAAWTDLGDTLGWGLAPAVNYEMVQQHDAGLPPTGGPQYVLRPAFFYLTVADNRVIAYNEGAWSWAGTAPASMDLTVSPSPDGLWQVEQRRSASVITDDGLEIYYVSLTARALDGRNLVWTPVAEWRGAGLGETFPSIYRWSENGRFLYLTNGGSADGCAIFFNGTDLTRIDLETGSAVSLLPPYSTLNLALSPDETWLAYAVREDGKAALALRDVAIAYDDQGNLMLDEANPAAVISLDVTAEAQIGSFIWSPDNNSLVITVANEPCSQNWTHTLLLVNVTTNEVTALWPADAQQLIATDWLTATTIRVVDVNSQAWQLDISTGTLTQGLP
ncbi:MAG: hypothetical protein R3E31_11130 [Chloroflexota bacterium]